MVALLLAVAGCRHEGSLVMVQRLDQETVRKEESHCRATPNNKATASGATTAACRQWVGCLVVQVQQEAWRRHMVALQVRMLSWPHLGDGTQAWDHRLTVEAGGLVHSAIHPRTGVDLLQVTGAVVVAADLLMVDGWVGTTTVVEVDVAVVEDAVAAEVVALLATLMTVVAAADRMTRTPAAIVATAARATARRCLAIDRGPDPEGDGRAERAVRGTCREAPEVETVHETQAAIGITVGTVEIATAVVQTVVAVVIGTAVATENAGATEVTTRAATVNEEEEARRSARMTAIPASDATATRAVAATSSDTPNAGDWLVHFLL